MTAKQVKEIMIESDAEESYVLDDYSEAFIGITNSGQAVYDYDKMVEIAQRDYEISATEAADYIQCNVLGFIPHSDSRYPIVVFNRVRKNMMNFAKWI